MPWLLGLSTLWYADHADALNEHDEVDCDEEKGDRERISIGAVNAMVG